MRVVDRQTTGEPRHHHIKPPSLSRAAA